MNNRLENNFVMEKLDTAFTSVDWINFYPHYGLKNQPILHSNHGLVLLDFDIVMPFRPRPFCFKHMWITHPSCRDVVQKAWHNHFIGSRAFQFKNKTHKLREVFTQWNRDVFGEVEKEIGRKKNELQLLQNSILNNEDVRKVRVLREELEVLMHRDELKWAQKDRNKGIILGDRNTRYFQTIVRQRRARNRILQIKTMERNISEDSSIIKNTICSHFDLNFSNPMERDHSSIFEELLSLSIPKLSSQQLDYLNKPITNDEIECTVFQLGPHKALGPDDIPAFFYQEYWDIVKLDIYNTIHAFFFFFLKSLNHAYITLIPKVAFPKDVSQFRPISLCNVIYKVISKIMVNRLKPLMDSLITPFLNAFI